MAESDDFSKVVSSRMRPTLQLLFALWAGGAWVASKTWEAAGAVREVQTTNTKQDESIERCLAVGAVHLAAIKSSDERNSLALQAIFSHQDLAMEMALEKLSGKRKEHYRPRIKVQRELALKLIYSIPVPKGTP